MALFEEFIVVMPRVEGSTGTGYRTTYYSDNQRFPSVGRAIRHGAVELDQADDFLVGKVYGQRLVSLQWMNELRSDPDELASAASDLCLEVAE